MSDESRVVGRVGNLRREVGLTQSVTADELSIALSEVDEVV